MKSAEQIMEILQAFGLTGSYRDAGELAGVSHHTVARYVVARGAGRGLDRAAARPQLIDEFSPKVEEWVEASKGKVRADVAHEKLLALGFTGSERTTRRAVAAVKKAHRLGNTRVHRPWVTEPGMWLQYDSVTARSSTGARRCCSAGGWPGPGSGWCWRSWTRPARACSPRWT